MNGGDKMSTDNKEHITVVSEAETEKEAAPEKKKFFTANRIEIIVAIFLGITALLTAWATWMASIPTSWSPPRTCCRWTAGPSPSSMS